MEKCKIVNYNDLRKSDKLNDYLVNNCLKVCKSASFPTDYKDVYEHLFGNPSYIKLFLINDNLEIKGFLVADYFKGYQDNSILHCHGLIIDSNMQNQGYGKCLVKSLIDKYNPDIVTMKTHNPRCFEVFTSFSDNLTYYPNWHFEIPLDIKRLVKEHPFLENVNDELVYERAYPDIKVMKDAYNDDINKIFINLGDFDAQAIVVVRHDNKLNLLCKRKRL